jgi:hypothetical protein
MLGFTALSLAILFASYKQLNVLGMKGEKKEEAKPLLSPIDGDERDDGKPMDHASLIDARDEPFDIMASRHSRQSIN